MTLGNLTMTQSVVGNTSQEFVLAGANSYRLQIGVVSVGTAAANVSTYTAKFTPSAPLTISGNVQQTAGSGAGSAVTLNLDGTASGNIISGNILNSADGTPKVLGISKTSTSSWTLSGTGNTYSGTTTITGGTLASSVAAQGFGTNLSGISIGGSGTLSLLNDSTTSFTNGTSAYNIANSASGATINVDRVSGTGTNIITVGNLTTTSTAVTWQLNFTGANGVSLNAGALTTPTAALGAHTINNTIAGGGPLTLASVAGGGTGATASLTFNGTGNTTVSGVITQVASAQSLTKQGAGSLTLSSVSSSFSGQVTLTGGTTNVTKIANIGSNSSLGTGNSSSSLKFNGGTMNYNGAGGDTTNRAVEMVASGAINNNSATGTIAFTAANVTHTGTASARTLTLGGNYTGGVNSFGSIIGDSGTSPNITSLVKNGSSTWKFSGANTYTGTTTVSAGTLELGASNVLPNASAVSIGAATLNASNFTDTAGTLDTTGAAVINLDTGGALAFANSSAVDWTGGTLNITGTYTPTSIRFGTTSGGLTSGQLASISVNGSGAGTYSLDADGYLVTGGDAVPPTLTSITDNVTGGPVNISATVTYTVTFNEDIDASTVTAADFGNSGTSTASIGNVTETTPGVFTVQATPSTSGTLRLRINAAAVLKDVAGNDLDTTSALLDDTTITVRTPYETWAAGYLPADVSNPALNFDGDGLTNLQEYAFGTNPTVSSGGSITWTPGSPVGSVTSRGTPVVIEEGGFYYAVYGRRVDHATSGLTYTQQFSPGLSVWGDFATAPTVIATDGTIDAVKVPFPDLFDFGSGPEKATFFRMEVSQ
jgi:fibronectin-binding autotransporter adhesin